MSLINDALKRANQNPASHTPPAGGAPLLAVAATAAPGRRAGSALFLGGVVLLVGMSAFFFWKWQQARQTATIATQTASPLVEPAPTAAPPQPAPAQPTTPAPDTREAAISQALASGPVPVAPNPTARISPPSQAPVVPAAAPAPPAPIRLQAILYRLKNPTAILNGRTLEVGQSVEGATLLEIQRNRVVLERQGRREMLELP